MKKILITVCLLVFSICLFSQEKTTIKYYSKFSLKKETIQSKAKYKIVSKTNEDVKIEELFRISDSRIFWHKSYRNNKPYGTWYYFNDENIITDSVVYGSYKPEGYYSYDFEDQKLTQNVEGEFIRPKMLNIDEKIYSIADQYKTSDFIVWVAENLVYPDEAKSNGICGQVKAQFTIDENGNVGDIRIIEGVDKTLDIASYKLLKSLPGMQPAKLNGKTIKLYIEAPFNFIMYRENSY